MPVVVVQQDPSVDAFNAPNTSVPIKSNVINRYTAGTLLIKNRTYFDLLFTSTNGQSFYVEQETARAFYFDDLQQWQFNYLPINRSGLLSTSVLLPYQLMTIELYREDEKIVEVYPSAYPVFGLPSNEIVSRNSQLYLVNANFATSPITGNMPLGLFLGAVNGRTITATILSIQLSIQTATFPVDVDLKQTGVDGSFSTAETAICTNSGVATVPLLHITAQNTSVTKVAGSSAKFFHLGANQLYELLAPGVLTLPALNYPTGGALGSGWNVYMGPGATTAYSWNVLWKEELN